MDHKGEIETKDSLIDKIVRYFIGGFCLLMGIMGISLIPVEKTSVFPYFLALVFTPLGLAVCSPKKIAPWFKAKIAYAFLPVTSKFEGVDFDRSIERFFSNKLTLGFFFLGFCALELWGLMSADDGKWLWYLLGAIMFGIMGLYSLFPSFTAGLGLFAGFIVVIGLLFGAAYAAYKAFGATPVAIVIGAMIIASAIKEKN